MSSRDHNETNIQGDTDDNTNSLSEGPPTKYSIPCTNNLQTDNKKYKMLHVK